MGRAAEAAEALESAALEAGCLSTARSLEDLRHLMMEQPFTLVVVGEGKRGKSSLINALLGRAISPVRESVPETAAVARFRWGRSFRASVRFLSEQECQNLGQFFQTCGQENCERVSQLLYENPPQEDRTLGSEESLRD
ncbi:MAG: dynamin family protein, partial [Mailhella sp.]|nr:dynamin family protein [Mailhella sp.]